MGCAWRLRNIEDISLGNRQHLRHYPCFRGSASVVGGGLDFMDFVRTSGEPG